MRRIAVALLPAWFACGVAAAEEAASRPAADRVAEAFRGECAAKAAAAEKADKMVVVGRDDWLFFTGELRHVGAGRFWGEEAAKASRATKPELADPLPAILDFKEQLDKLGIELILVPVPPKVFIYPDKLSEKSPAPKLSARPATTGTAAVFPRLNTYHQEFYNLLGGKGVKVLDLTGEFLTPRELDKPNGALYCKTDTHWSPWGCEVAARTMAADITKRPWAKAHASPFSTQARTIEITGDLAAALDPRNAQKEKLPARFVWLTGSKDEAAAPVDRSSPVLVLGDSHALVFNAGGDMHGTRAGFADQLAAELGFAVDLIAVRGSGATDARIALYRQAAEDKEYLAKKKVVVWCFGAREFTESDGWRKVPVTKPAPGNQ
jgi:alginate O-acetyltransferase complex protein AlgJ